MRRALVMVLLALFVAGAAACGGKKAPAAPKADPQAAPKPAGDESTDAMERKAAPTKAAPPAGADPCEGGE
jgi:hypothetical protein